jgi:hypothetical protein
MFLTMKRLMALSFATNTPDASQRTLFTWRQERAGKPVNKVVKYSYHGSQILSMSSCTHKNHSHDKLGDCESPQWGSKTSSSKSRRKCDGSSRIRTWPRPCLERPLFLLFFDMLGNRCPNSSAGRAAVVQPVQVLGGSQECYWLVESVRCSLP